MFIFLYLIELSIKCYDNYHYLITFRVELIAIIKSSFSFRRLSISDKYNLGVYLICVFKA